MAGEKWYEGNNFFGPHYIDGDNSKEGYLTDKKNLEIRTKEEVEGVMKLLGIGLGSKILDLPCGYGRHSNGLSQEGFQVVGADINEYHLERAKKEANNLEKKPEFIYQDMIDLDRQNDFDAIINMFYSFGFFETDEENFQVLRNFYKALKDSGKFLMHTDVNIPRIKEGKYKTDETRNLISGKTLKIVDNYNPLTKRIEGRWTIDNKTKKYSVRVYDQLEFVNLCKKAGFRSCEVYGDWNGNMATNDSEDLMFVATK